jgi:L-threonylcarbamoyladenylate synthase
MAKALAGKNLERIGIISFDATHDEVSLAHQMVLSPSADLHEAGRRLYHALRLMDKLDLDLLLIERLPEYGLGLTINDRLEKAAARRHQSTDE